MSVVSLSPCVPPSQDKSWCSLFPGWLPVANDSWIQREMDFWGTATGLVSVSARASNRLEFPAPLRNMQECHDPAWRNFLSETSLILLIPSSDFDDLTDNFVFISYIVLKENQNIFCTFNRHLIIETNPLELSASLWDRSQGNMTMSNCFSELYGIFNIFPPAILCRA